VAVDKAGNVYLASSNSNHVLELPKGGTAPSQLAFTGLNEPNAVAVDDKGTAYVTDAGNNRVIKLPPQS
jgi:serine/threonine protein kinase, bacterial